MMNYVLTCDMDHGVRCRTYKAIIERKPYSVGFGKMSVDYIAVQLVNMSESREESVCLSTQIIFRSDVYKPFATEILKLLMITKYGALFCVLCVVEKCHDLVFFTIEQNKRDGRGRVLILHSRRKGTFIFFEYFCNRGRYFHIFAYASESICRDSSGAEKY